MSSADYIRHIRFFPVVDATRCIGCRVCERTCASGVFSFSTEVAPCIDDSLCHNCRKCVEACQAHALRIDAVFDGSGHRPMRLRDA